MARFVAEDGSLRMTRENLSSDLRRDLFQITVRMSWPRVLAGFLLLYLGASLVFTVLYLADPGSLVGRRVGVVALDTFFYSGLTFGGAGHEVIHPGNSYGNLITLIQSVTGLMLLAMITGLCFAKFSLPQARVRFSKRVLLSKFEGRPALMIRLANERDIPVVDARIQVFYVQPIVTAEGVNLRRSLPLKLQVGTLPVFILALTVVHFLDETSPLYGVTPEELAGGEKDIYVMFTGIDAVAGASVHAFCGYDGVDMVRGGQFADVVTHHPDGSRTIDYGRLDEVVPAPPTKEVKAGPDPSSSGGVA